MLERLVKIKGGIVNQAPGKRNPTSDPEATKYVMAEMLREAGVEILLHSWAAQRDHAGQLDTGGVFESKSGSYAVTSKAVVDATGDGDVYGAAGAEHVRHIHRIGLVTGWATLIGSSLRRGRGQEGRRRWGAIPRCLAFSGSICRGRKETASTSRR